MRIAAHAAVQPSESVAPPDPAPGLVPVGNEDGQFVGWIDHKYIDIPPEQYFATVNAQTMFPVTDAQFNVVGYVAPDVPFVPLATTQLPGFDIEKVRAARNGGCEDQIGQPSFQQEFPPCNDGNTGSGATRSSAP